MLCKNDNSVATTEILSKTAYLACTGRSAISSHGEEFFIGETVGHQGVIGEETAVIEGFILDPENADIVVQTSKGTCTIEFLLKV